MPNYFPKSKEVANDFIQSIVFIDDEANVTEAGNGDHQLNALEITKGFAKSQKICAVYNPVSEADLTDLISIGKKADVLVLDWKIDLPQQPVHGKEEEDADSEDPRGRYTIQIIKDIIFDEQTGKDSLKLIIIYTGETDLWGITKAIFDSLTDVQGIQHDDFSISSSNIRILVIGKPTLKAKHISEIENRIVDWNQLPDFILDEFTKLTYGLLSNTVLKALIAVRQKAFKLVKTFPTTLDPAFLGHKALLPNPDDAEEQILDIVGSEIKSILKSYNPGHYLSNGLIKDYIEEVYEDKKYPLPLDKTLLPSLELVDEVDRNLLTKFVESGIERVFLKKDTPFSESVSLGAQCHHIATDLYSLSKEQAIESNRQFALLTSIKTNYNPSTQPLLTLGTILKKKDDTYWLCIQPKCDAIRIEKNREFLLASLKRVENDQTKFDFLINIEGSYLFFKINYSIYKAQLLRFKANKNRTVRGTISDGKIIFTGDSIMEWVGELKNDFSQSIANNFASEISRVGMDHSEWLRRWSTM